MQSNLNLVRLTLDRREMLRVSARHRQPSYDEGYALHAGLSELFATSKDHAKVPLRNFYLVPSESKDMTILAYSDKSESDLRGSLGPKNAALLNLETNPVPSLAAGTVAAFQVRVCPVIRTTQGKEIDAYIQARSKLSKDAYISRESVYVDWLKGQFKGYGVELREAHLTEFRIQRLYRERGEKPSQHPDALIKGVLVIQEPRTHGDEPPFQELLARGVGRHRSFGFGTLLLSRVG